MFKWMEIGQEWYDFANLSRTSDGWHRALSWGPKESAPWADIEIAIVCNPSPFSLLGVAVKRGFAPGIR